MKWLSGGGVSVTNGMNLFGIWVNQTTLYSTRAQRAVARSAWLLYLAINDVVALSGAASPAPDGVSGCPPAKKRTMRGSLN